jgi:hypothetical protein
MAPIHTDTAIPILPTRRLQQGSEGEAVIDLIEAFRAYAKARAVPSNSWPGHGERMWLHTAFVADHLRSHPEDNEDIHHHLTEKRYRKIIADWAGRTR